jgi:hypothetical protein
MSFNILPTPLFDPELKKLSKKHLSLKKDLADQILSLVKDPTQGEALGKNCFKVGMAIFSKNKGKSGGARTITFVKVAKEMVYLVSIYDKSEADTISDNEILNRIKDL